MGSRIVRIGLALLVSRGRRRVRPVRRLHVRRSVRLVHREVGDEPVVAARGEIGDRDHDREAAAVAEAHVPVVGDVDQRAPFAARDVGVGESAACRPGPRPAGSHRGRAGAGSATGDPVVCRHRPRAAARTRRRPRTPPRGCRRTTRCARSGTGRAAPAARTASAASRRRPPTRRPAAGRAGRERGALTGASAGQASAIAGPGSGTRASSAAKIRTSAPPCPHCGAANSLTIGGSAEQSICATNVNGMPSSPCGHARRARGRAGPRSGCGGSSPGTSQYPGRIAASTCSRCAMRSWRAIRRSTSARLRSSPAASRRSCSAVRSTSPIVPACALPGPRAARA